VHGGSGVGGYVAITGTADSTDVAITLGPKGRIIAGGGLPFTASAR